MTRPVMQFIMCPSSLIVFSVLLLLGRTREDAITELTRSFISACRNLHKISVKVLFRVFALLRHQPGSLFYPLFSLKNEQIVSLFVMWM